MFKIGLKKAIQVYILPKFLYLSQKQLLLIQDYMFLG